MELNVKRVVYHILDTGASEPLLSDREADLDADLTEKRPFPPTTAASAIFCPIRPLLRNCRATRISSTCPAASPA